LLEIITHVPLYIRDVLWMTGFQRLRGKLTESEFSRNES